MFRGIWRQTNQYRSRSIHIKIKFFSEAYHHLAFEFSLSTSIFVNHPPLFIKPLNHQKITEMSSKSKRRPRKINSDYLRINLLKKLAFQRDEQEEALKVAKRLEVMKLQEIPKTVESKCQPIVDEFQKNKENRSQAENSSMTKVATAT